MQTQVLSPSLPVHATTKPLDQGGGGVLLCHCHGSVLRRDLLVLLLGEGVEVVGVRVGGVRQVGLGFVHKPECVRVVRQRLSLFYSFYAVILSVLLVR